MIDRVDIKTIAAALGIEKRTAERRAIGESWPFVEQPGRGGKKRLYPLNSLPKAVREAVHNHLLVKHIEKEHLHETTTKAGNVDTCGKNGAEVNAGKRDAVHGVGNAGDGHAAAATASRSPGRKATDGSLQRAGGVGCSDIAGRHVDPDATSGGTGIVAASRGVAGVHGTLNDDQLECNKARAIIVRYVGDFAGNIEQAISHLNAERAVGRLIPALAWAFERAWDKPRENTKLNKSTYNNWLHYKKTRGSYAPIKCGKDYTITQEVLLALKHYQAPQKPSLRASVERAAAELGITEAREIDAYYHRVNRFKDKVGAPDLQHGRMGTHELRTLKPFIRRDTSQLYPGDVYTADGHKFDAEIANPRTGKPFRPEITSIMDVATRKLVGWSIDLAESGFAVLYALTHAITSNAIPLIFYVDNGSGYNNALISGEGTGMLGLLNIRQENSLPYNSQAKGLIERSHQTLWVRAAKELPTYIGADMDKEARQKVFKITRKHIKEAGKSHLLMEMDEFSSFINTHGTAYNNKPQRGLPRFRHPEHGTWVHHSPNSYWALLESQGKLAERANEDELRHLMRPQEKVSIRNGEIRLFNNLYFSAELDAFHGEDARAAYEIHDASRIWVYAMDGRFICTAEWNANKRAYFPQSLIDQQLEKRAKGRMKRAQVKVDEAYEELHPLQVIEHQPAVVLPVVVPDQVASVGKEIEPESTNVMALPISRPIFTSDATKYRWLRTNASQVTEQDNAWLDWYCNTGEWEDLFGDVQNEVAAQ